MNSEPEGKVGWPDGSLQVAIHRILDPWSLEDEGGWLHHNKKLIVVNRVVCEQEKRLERHGKDYA